MAEAEVPVTSQACDEEGAAADAAGNGPPVDVAADAEGDDEAWVRRADALLHF